MTGQADYLTESWQKNKHQGLFVESVLFVYTFQVPKLKPFVRTQELNIKIHLRCDQSTAFLSFRCTPRFRSELAKKAQH